MSKEICNEIFRQFGGNRAMVMIGGTPMTEASASTLHVIFKGCRKYNRVMIKYVPSYDTYEMKFIKYVKSTGMVKAEKIIPGVYCDMMKEIFEETTGLYLSL